MRNVERVPGAEAARPVGGLLSGRAKRGHWSWTRLSTRFTAVPSRISDLVGLGFFGER